MKPTNETGVTDSPEEIARGSLQQHGSVAYGVIDPDYARIYTVIRCLAWQEGYAAMMHGSFTRDLDIVAVPWTDEACEPEHLVCRVLASNLNLSEAAPGKPGSKPHGRRVWTLMLPEFGDPRFVDLSICQPLNAGTQRPGTSDAEPATRTPMPGSLE